MYFGLRRNSLFCFLLLLLTTQSFATNSCIDLISSVASAQQVSLASGYYYKKIPSAASTAPLKDYRLYIYPESLSKPERDLFIHKLPDENSLTSLTRSLKNGIRYIHSIRSNDYLSDIAFFETPKGEVFGISHIELFDGNLTLKDYAKTSLNLSRISDVFLQKRTEPSLDLMFNKRGSAFFRFNIRKDVKTGEKRPSSIIDDPSLRLYQLPGSADSVFAYRSFLSNNLQIEIIDTLNGQVKGGRTVSANGQQLQRKLLDEILDFVLPLYAERRGWSQEFALSLREKAHATVNSTKYVIVRDPETNQIIATIGLSRAPYGKATFRSDRTWDWQEVYGTFGGTVSQNGLGPLLPKMNTLDKPVPILPMEAYLGYVMLPRPSVVETIFRNFHQAPFITTKEGDSLGISTFDPVFAGSGIIYEPTKFAVARNVSKRKLAHATILKELFAATFDLQYENALLNSGQYLYTYNDKNGIRLYQSMGFQVMGGLPKVSKDGTTWTVLGLSPQSMIEQVKELSRSEGASEAVSLELENQLAVKHER